MREMLLIEICSSSTRRPALPEVALATLNPPIETGTLSGGAPPIEIERDTPPPVSIAIPGTNFKNSPTLPSAT